MSTPSLGSSRSFSPVELPAEDSVPRADDSTEDSILTPHCECPRDDYHGVIHQESCLMYKHETIDYAQDEDASDSGSPRFEDGVCKCCGYPSEECRCRNPGRDEFNEWQRRRDFGEMPVVLETTHPLMKRFQDALKGFLIKENSIAEDAILNLRNELKLSKQQYDKDLEMIYKNDHDTNAQRKMIEEYEASLGQLTADRVAADERVKNANERYKRVRERMEQENNTEREAMEELQALTILCKQLEEWREETESDLAVSQRMSNKMRIEKQALADDKREMDIIIFSLSNEVWNLESKMEMFKKELEIKNNEMEIVNDRVTAYAAELEDLDLDKRRLVSLWNSVLVNISQRDNIYDSVKEDYRNLQENYRTLLCNLEITKKMALEEMNRGKEIEMNKDKIIHDLERATKQLNTENERRMMLEAQIQQLAEAIELTNRDEQLIKMENETMRNILKNSMIEFDKKAEEKVNLENDILANIQECLVNDKSVQSMANGIKKMREMSRKLDIQLLEMENQHAKLMLDIEIHKNDRANNKIILEEELAKVKEKQKEVEQLEEKYARGNALMGKKQRELEIVLKKQAALKEIFDSKSPQERRVEELEKDIRSLRERTETVQHEWLRLQGHVVKLTEQHSKMAANIVLVNKQIQICDQKILRLQADSENVMVERNKVDRTLRELRSKVELLERTRKDSLQRNESCQRANLTVTYEYSASLKDAEMEILQLEEEIEAMEREKMNLLQKLDRAQREALIWQRKGILATELKKNVQEAKSEAGEISQMRAEIHRMEVRREQLRRTAEKLAEDLALYVTRRENAMEKSRATAAVEEAHGTAYRTSQSTYQHKVRLARADVARVSKELSEAETRLKLLQEEQDRLNKDVADTSAVNAQLEEQVATLMRDCREAERHKQWLLERVVRSQRLGSELAAAIKRQSIRVKKPKPTVLKEYQQACDLNTKLREIVDTLKREYPHLSERLEVVTNTLNVHSPTGTPRLMEESELYILEDGGGENVAEKPFSP